MASKKTKLKFITLIFLLLTLIIAIQYFDLKQYITVNELKETIASYGIFAPLAFITLYIIVSLAFLPGTPVTILGGVLFGTIKGSIYTIIGATIGATIAFLIARYLAQPFAQEITKKKLKRIYEYDKELEKKGLITVLFLRLMPLFPFNGLNFALGITKVKTKDYIIATAIGIIPAVVIYTYFGNSLATLNTINIIISVILIALLGLIYPIYKKNKKGKNKS